MEEHERNTERLDKTMVIRGLVSSRTRAAELIDQGLVQVNGVVSQKRDHAVGTSDVVALLAEEIPWVSRAALKLIHALDHWGVVVADKVALDIGASTGGFTEVLLARGAAHVFALDVGHDQLAPRVAQDPRVTNWEGVHINTVTVDQFDPCPELIVIDVSFISLTKILATVKALTPLHGTVIALIKPQFEVGREAIGHGVVRDARLHQSAVEGVVAFARALGFRVSEPIPSPILGGDGNKEFLLKLERIR